MKKLTWKVEKMVCNGCEKRIHNALKTIKGVEEVTANYQTGMVTIEVDDSLDEKVVKEKIEDIGFKVVEED